MTESNPQDDNLKMRLESINRMLLEVASGNFDCKIERSDRNDELEALVVVANMMAEEMKESFLHRGYPDDTYKNIAGMTLVLDNNFNIQTFNPGVTEVLLFDAKELDRKPLADFLTSESKEVLKILKLHLEPPDDFTLAIELSFKTKQGLVVPASCSVSSLFNTAKRKREILITAIETIRHSKVAEEQVRYAIERRKTKDRNPAADIQHKTRVALRDADIRTIRNVKDHILQNLEVGVSLKELTIEFGINEFKLKHGFKQLYGMPIFRFLREERLKKATLLLQNTDIPLKKIAEMTGFKSFPHFSKAFKIRFGYCPSDLKKEFISRRETEL